MCLTLVLGLFIVALVGFDPSYSPVARLIYALMVATSMGAKVALRGTDR
jgi:hypothetical protein